MATPLIIIPIQYSVTYIKQILKGSFKSSVAAVSARILSFWKADPDPDPQQNQKPNPDTDPHRTKNSVAVEAQNGAVEAQNGAVEGL